MAGGPHYCCRPYTGSSVHERGCRPGMYPGMQGYMPGYPVHSSALPRRVLGIWSSSRPLASTPDQNIISYEGNTALRAYLIYNIFNDLVWSRGRDRDEDQVMYRTEVLTEVRYMTRLGPVLASSCTVLAMCGYGLPHWPGTVLDGSPHPSIPYPPVRL